MDPLLRQLQPLWALSIVMFGTSAVGSLLEKNGWIASIKCFFITNSSFVTFVIIYHRPFEIHNFGRGTF